ncbi:MULTISPECIES: hypothetical protein [Vibrio]|nr:MULTISPECIES: hypothetical protein [Vibrio]MBS9949395.1 hypothetical protein [Vibrio alginolyticus]HCM0814589.1 hypothetical protein [Vibrio parahaemolyticus]
MNGSKKPKAYYRMFAGKANVHLLDCVSKGYIGLEFRSSGSLEHLLNGGDKAYVTSELIKIYKNQNTKASNVTAGISSHTFYKFFKDVEIGDIIISPKKSKFIVGRVTGSYEYDPTLPLAHYRKIEWLQEVIHKENLPVSVLNSAGSIGVFCDLSRYSRVLDKSISLDGRVV